MASDSTHSPIQWQVALVPLCLVACDSLKTTRKCQNPWLLSSEHKDVLYECSQDKLLYSVKFNKKGSCIIFLDAISWRHERNSAYFCNLKVLMQRTKGHFKCYSISLCLKGLKKILTILLTLPSRRAIRPWLTRVLRGGRVKTGGSLLERPCPRVRLVFETWELVANWTSPITLQTQEQINHLEQWSYLSISLNLLKRLHMHFTPKQRRWNGIYQTRPKCFLNLTGKKNVAISLCSSFNTWAFNCIFKK